MTKHNILIIVEDTFTREIIHNIFFEKKIKSFNTENWIEGLTILYKIKVDLIVIESTLIGIKINEFIKILNIFFKEIPVIIISEKNPEIITVESRKLYNIKKPFNNSKLEKVLKKIFDLKPDKKKDVKEYKTQEIKNLMNNLARGFSSSIHNLNNLKEIAYQLSTLREREELITLILKKLQEYFNSIYVGYYKFDNNNIKSVEDISNSTVLESKLNKRLKKFSFKDIKDKHTVKEFKIQNNYFIVLPVFIRNDFHSFFVICQESKNKRFLVRYDKQKEYIESLKDFINISVENTFIYDSIMKYTSDRNRMFHLLNKISFIMGEYQNISQIYDKTVETISSFFDFETVVIMGYDDDKNMLFTQAATGLTNENWHSINLNTDKFYRDIFSSNEPYFCSQHDYETDKNNTHPIISIPISYENKNLGLINIFGDVKLIDFGKDNKDLLLSISIILGGTIQNYILHQKVLEKKYIEYELDIAREIQSNLLPKRMPNIDKIEVKSFYSPAERVGGDHYNYYYDKDRNLFDFVVADSSGHGIGASILMTMTATGWHILRKQFESINDVIYNLNLFLIEKINHLSGNFVSFFMGRIDMNKNELRYINCGIPLPIVSNPVKKTIQELKSNNMILGVENITFKTDKIDLDSNDVIYVFTDGIIESRNFKKKQYGTSRIKKIIKQNRNMGFNKRFYSIIKDVEKYVEYKDLSDDVTLLSIKYSK